MAGHPKMFTSSAVVMPPQRQNPGQNQNTKTPKHQNTKTPKHKTLQKHLKSTSDLGYKP
jgi:hypothetical protein